MGRDFFGYVSDPPKEHIGGANMTKKLRKTLAIFQEILLGFYFSIFR